MNKWFQDVLDLLKSSGLPMVLILLLVFVLYVAATKPENFKIYFGFLWHLLAGPFKFLRKKAIRFRIEGPLTKALKNIAKELPDIEIPELEIKWVKSNDLTTKLKEGKAIIKLKFDNDNTRNIIKATTIYVKDAFLRNTKPYLSENFTKALDLTVSKKILLHSEIKNRGNIIPIFIDENRNENVEVFEKFEKLEEIDDNGLFTRVILRELNYLGERLFGRVPKPEYKEEVDEFLNFVHTVVTRDYDDNTPLAFNHNVLKVGFLLVAKADTFNTYGLEAYYRRIRLSLAAGIKTFYLMARSDKVEILETVANELLQTGNFILRNSPKEFIDNHSRKCICFSIEVNGDSILASTLEDIGNCIKNKQPIKGVITSVRETRLLIDVNGVSGEVKFHNLSSGEIQDARHYFKEGSDIELMPLEILEGGSINFSLKGTKSDPLNFVKSQYEIGKEIQGKVIYADDSFIKLDVGNDIIEGIAFRPDLTFSKYIFLHEKFPENTFHDFIIKDYDFDRGRIILALKDLDNPFETHKYRIGQSVKFTFMKKSKNSFVGEIEEGIQALIPKHQLAWTEKEQGEMFSNISLSSELKAFITSIEEDIFILSCKDYSNNPYQKYFDQNKDQIVDFVIENVTEYGIIGKIDSYNVYIPKFEMSWGKSIYKYYVGKTYKVSIKNIGKNRDKLIGSFKPILKHPLTEFNEKFGEGVVLKRLKIKSVFDWGIIYEIKYNGNSYEGYLLKKNISASYFIENIQPISKLLDQIPLCVAEVDMEQNRIILSLKKLTELNITRYDQLDYQHEYDSFIISQKGSDYGLLIPKIWIEGLLETDRIYSVGDSVKVRPIQVQEDLVVFSDE